MENKMSKDWQGAQIHLNGEYAILHERHYKELLASVVNYRTENEKLQKQLEGERSQIGTLIQEIHQLQAFAMMLEEYSQGILEKCGVKII